MIITASNLTKEFRIGAPATAREAIRRAFGRLRGGAPPRPSDFKAIDDVNFTVAPGEVLGIIGQNGAGKSTLLKLLAGVSKPTGGRLEVKGRVAPLIEVGAGLVGDLTGRENVFLNGAILGMPRREIRRKLDEIVAFAELERFLDTPLKRYSSGMQVRLGFAIATAVDSDILIIDEVLAVGDIAFQRKCYDRMHELIHGQGRTILFVSHNVKEIERLSHRVLLLDHGRIAALGDPADVCNEYFERTHRRVLAHTQAERLHARVQSSGEISVSSIEVLDHGGSPSEEIEFGRPCAFRITLDLAVPLDKVEIEFGIHTLDALRLATCTSASSVGLPDLAPGRHRFSCHLARMPFLPGVYAIRLHVGAGAANHGLFYGEHLARFVVRGEAGALPPVVRQGFVALDAAWSELQPAAQATVS